MTSTYVSIKPAHVATYNSEILLHAHYGCVYRRLLYFLQYPDGSPAGLLNVNYPVSAATTSTVPGGGAVFVPENSTGSPAPEGGMVGMVGMGAP